MVKCFLYPVLLAGFIIYSSTAAFAQRAAAKPFTGTVIYDLSASGIDSVFLNLVRGSTMTIYVDDHKSRTELSTLTHKQTIITDKEERTSILLFEGRGDKLMAVKRANDAREEGGRPEITYLKETRDIAGYSCLKAMVRIPGNPEPVTVFYTPDLSGNPSPEFIALPGFPLEYELFFKGVKMTATARLLTQRKPDEDLFIPPKDYTEVSPERIAEILSGM